MGWDSDDSAWAKQECEAGGRDRGRCPTKACSSPIAHRTSDLQRTTPLFHLKTWVLSVAGRRRVRVPLHVVREAAALYISQALLIHSPCVALERLVCADERVSAYFSVLGQ